MKRIIIQRSFKLGRGMLLIVLFWGGYTLASEKYELVDEWGSPGSGDGQFYEVVGLVIDSEGSLYLSDFTNDNVQKFTSEGDFITKWGNHGSEDGEFIGPRGIDIDDEGNVYVADFLNDRVQKFTSEGDFITKWSTKVEGIWMYSVIWALAVDNTGNVYVQHSSITPPGLYYNCIQKFTSEGGFINKWPFLWFSVYELATDSEGNLYAPGLRLAPMQKFNSNGELVDQWPTCSTEEVFCSNTGVAIDGEGNIYVSDMMHHCVKKFTKDGELITKWELEGPGGFGSEPTPSALAVDDEGYVYVSDTSNYCIQKYAKVSDTTTTINGPCPSEIALEGNPSQLELLRNFRDKILSATLRGKDYIDSYYQHSSEVASLLLANDKLKDNAKKLLCTLLVINESNLRDEEIALSEELVTKIESFANDICSKASPPLQEEISNIQRDIREGKFFEVLGISSLK